MGLGPPVCAKCKILYAYDDGGAIRWQCPKCKAMLDDCELHLWDLTSDKQNEYLDRSSEFRDAEKKKRRECLLKRS